MEKGARRDPTSITVYDNGVCTNWNIWSQKFAGLGVAPYELKMCNPCLPTAIRDLLAKSLKDESQVKAWCTASHKLERRAILTDQRLGSLATDGLVVISSKKTTFLIDHYHGVVHGRVGTTHNDISKWKQSNNTMLVIASFTVQCKCESVCAWH